MAVYEGARPFEPPAPTAAAPRGAGPAAAAAARHGPGNRRASRTSMILGGIVVAFLLAFFSLAQDVPRVGDDDDIDRLQAEVTSSYQEQEIRSDLERLGQ